MRNQQVMQTRQTLVQQVHAIQSKEDVHEHLNAHVQSPARAGDPARAGLIDRDVLFIGTGVYHSFTKPCFKSLGERGIHPLCGKQLAQIDNKQAIQYIYVDWQRGMVAHRDQGRGQRKMRSANLHPSGPGGI